MADQIVTVSKKRFQNKVAKLSGEDVRAVENAIKIQLGFR